MNTLSIIFITMLTVPLAATAAFGSRSTTTAAEKKTNIDLPPLDTAAPSRFETASFGLG